MKHLGNEARIRKELELETVPQAIENRLRRVYAELPGEVPATYAGRPGAYTEGVWEEVKAAPRRLSWPLRGWWRQVC